MTIEEAALYIAQLTGEEKDCLTEMQSFLVQTHLREKIPPVIVVLEN